MRAKASGESTLLLVDAVQVLRAAQVDYAIIGAMAASVHGVIRASRDADALLSITVPALPDLERSFRATGFTTELRRGDVDDPISAVLTLHDEFENRVDLLVGIRGFDPQAFSRTIDVPLDGEPLRFVSLEDFIAMKIFAGSPQDVSDATTALEVATEPLDVNLLRQLASRYGADTARSLENVLATLSRGSDPTNVNRG
jgi:predicted nucleotidyltransferase